VARSNFCKGINLTLKRVKKVGTKFLKFGPNRANLATLLLAIKKQLLHLIEITILEKSQCCECDLLRKQGATVVNDVVDTIDTITFTRSFCVIEKKS